MRGLPIRRSFELFAPAKGFLDFAMLTYMCTYVERYSIAFAGTAHAGKS